VVALGIACLAATRVPMAVPDGGRRRRLTDEELRRLHPMLAERLKGNWNLH
jgi:hypothetical protein